MPKSWTGNIGIAVDAIDAAAMVVASGQQNAVIVAGGRIEVVVALSLVASTDAGVPDAGIGDGPMPVPDVPPDFGITGQDGASNDPTQPPASDVLAGRDVSAGRDAPAGVGPCIFGGGVVYQPGESFVVNCVTYVCQGDNDLLSSGLPCSDAADSLPDAMPEALVDVAPDGSNDTAASSGPEAGEVARPDSGRDTLLPDVDPLPVCGNGVVEPYEGCDCGSDPDRLPRGCPAVNGLFYGDGKGCSKTCTREPSCRDGNGKNRACDPVCGDGRVEQGESCDDGNARDGDGCSSSCLVENGFTCKLTTVQDTSTCGSGTGQCMTLPVIYRDFQPENVVGGHPDFCWLGTGSPGEITRWCVPNSAGPSKGNDSTARCWGIVAEDLLDGKPQPGPTRSCACQFSDWSLGNSTDHIGGRYAASDSPLAGTDTMFRSDVSRYTENGGPIWSGTVPAYKDATSVGQWWTDDASVNKTYRDTLELESVGSIVYQYASAVRRLEGGFFPLDTLNPTQRTLCNLWPYWNNKFFPSCVGDQYLFPPRVWSADCPMGDDYQDGCWLLGLAGSKHDSYFTSELRYHFVYDASTGISIQFYGDDDLFIFVNGKMVLDLGGIHQQIPGKVTISGEPGKATIIEGGCLDTAGNITGATTGSTACAPTNSEPPGASSPGDFRNRSVDLGLESDKVYELAIFGSDRHPPESNFQLTLSGFAFKRSYCSPNI